MMLRASGITYETGKHNGHSLIVLDAEGGIQMSLQRLKRASSDG
jgi:hypothetical protein